MEKEKDVKIHFGAFDSELHECEFTIPEGYEAKIEDGKVIVRKAESEDERIRKELIFYLRYQHSISENFEDIGKCIAWLEKKGEQKPTELPKGEDYGIDGLYAAIDILKTTLGKVDGYQTDDGILEHKCAINAVKSLYEQPSAWSEEDDAKLKSILFHIEDVENKDVIDWLKNLKDRVQPQPKNEWSEEDIKMIRLLVAIFKVNYPNGLYKVNPIDTPNMQGIHSSEIIKWLKSLKNRYTWKPSEEQIKVCKEVYADILSAKGFDLGTVNSELNRMEEELKKLKG